MNRDDFKGWFGVSLCKENIWPQLLNNVDGIIKGCIVDALRLLWYPHVDWIRGLVGVGQVMDKTVFLRWFSWLKMDRWTMKFWKRWHIKGPGHSTQLNLLVNLKRHLLQGRLHFWIPHCNIWTRHCSSYPRQNPKVKTSSRKLTSSWGYPCKYGLMALKSTANHSGLELTRPWNLVKSRDPLFSHRPSKALRMWGNAPWGADTYSIHTSRSEMKWILLSTDHHTHHTVPGWQVVPSV